MTLRYICKTYTSQSLTSNDKTAWFQIKSERPAYIQTVYQNQYKDTIKSVRFDGIPPYYKAGLLM